MNLSRKNIFLSSYKSKAFTLIEVMVVISIIGLLSSIVLASLTTSRQKAIGARIVAEAHSIVTAIELYRADNNGTAPTQLTDLVPKYIGTIPTSASWQYRVSSNSIYCGPGLKASPYIVYYQYTNGTLNALQRYDSTDSAVSGWYCDTIN